MATPAIGRTSLSRRSRAQSIRKCRCQAYVDIPKTVANWRRRLAALKPTRAATTATGGGGMILGQQTTSGFDPRRCGVLVRDGAQVQIDDYVLAARSGLGEA